MASKAKVSVTLDADALEVVDRSVAEHPDVDRSKVLREALALWLAVEQRRAVQAQYEPLDGEDAAVLAEELADWRSIRDAAAARQFSSEQR